MTSRPSSAAYSYVPAIDSLRAFAVLSVILYHLGARWVPGGFVGVDIFFVISGYVVSLSLARDPLSTFREFASRFYVRRLARIYPALSVCLVTTFLLAVLFIPDSWLSDVTRKTGLRAFFGLSNLVLVTSDDGYFSPRVEFNPFTHTWSLAVEEQFYLIHPLLIFAWLKWRQATDARRHVARLALPLLLAASLIYSMWTTSHTPDAAFYLLPSRFWELGCGAVLYQYSSRALFQRISPRSVDLMLTVGLALMMGSFFVVRPAPFPFPFVILPVAGTTLCLAAMVCDKARASFWVKALQQRALVYIGLISYSLYLWHWPIYVLFRWTTGLATTWQFALALALVGACAVLSYHLVELPLRQRLRRYQGSRLRFLAAGVAAIGLCAVSAGVVFAARPWLSLSTVTRHAGDWYPYPLPIRHFATDGSHEFEGRQLFVVGDSHVVAYATLLSSIEQQTGVAVHSLWVAGCEVPTLVAPLPTACAHFVQTALRRLEREAVAGDIVFLPGLRSPRFSEQWASYDVDSVIASSSSDSARADREAALAVAYIVIGRILKTGASVLFENPKPIYPAPPFRCSDWFNAMNPVCRGGVTVERDKLARLNAPIYDSIRALRERYPELGVFDPLPVLCPGQVCSAFDATGQPLFFDGDHLSAHGNLELYQAFLQALRASARRQP